MHIINILVPNLPESVNTATVVSWHKKIGEDIKQDEILVEIETDKIILEVAAECDGYLESIHKIEGNIVNSKQILGTITCKKNTNKEKIKKPIQKNLYTDNQISPLKTEDNNIDNYSPAIRRLISSNNIDAQKLQKKITDKRLNRQNIESYIQKINNSDHIVPQEKLISNITEDYRKDIKRVKMNNVRKCISNRLLNVVNNTAMLTTFNEVNMHEIIKLRERYGDDFKKKHGIRLGFMSFYVKAVIEALKQFPIINASIDDEDIIYYNYFDINIAISSTRGLVTPVLKNANLMNMYEIEKKIQEFSEKVRNSKLDVSDLVGGTFTITNGGVFGSLLSTPIINPPQSAILGIHYIKERPIAVNNEVVIQPMMYLALSYDHRLIDGQEAIGFLLKIKKILEDFNLIILKL